MNANSDPQGTLTWCFYHNIRHPYDGFMTDYIFKPLKYSFVQKHYDRPLAEFVRELPEVTHRFSTVHGPGGEEWMTGIINQMELAGIDNLFPLLEQVSTQSKAQDFLAESGIEQPSLMEWIDYLKQWWFPYPATLRQLVDEDGDPLLQTTLVKLKEVKIANSFTLLEAASEGPARADLADRLHLDRFCLLDLVHRADVSRLPYISGGAVKRLWVMGYRSLADLCTVNPQDYSIRIHAYFENGGKGTTFDAKMSSIVGFLQDARHAAEVVKEI